MNNQNTLETLINSETESDSLERLVRLRESIDEFNEAAFDVRDELETAEERLLLDSCELRLTEVRRVVAQLICPSCKGQKGAGGMGGGWVPCESCGGDGMSEA